MVQRRPSETERFEQLIGFYRMPGYGVVQVEADDDVLRLRLPGLPAGWEIPLIPEGPDRFLMKGGPLADGGAVFERRGEEPAPRLLLGPYTFERISPAAAQAAEAPHYLPEPEASIDGSMASAFEACFRASEGGDLDYSLPFPRYLFLLYLAQHHPLLFHGSNDLEIDLFEPRRKSYELYDPTGRGNLKAVYATPYPLWAMFYAVLDRAMLEGSMQSGPITLTRSDGETKTFYQFSIDADSLQQSPWREGMVYLLPQEAFEQLLGPQGDQLAEWASQSPVRPIARLRVAPEDFPFLDGVRGQTNPEVTEADALRERFLEQAEETIALDDGAKLRLPLQAETYGLIQAWLDLQIRLTPQVEIRLERKSGEGFLWLQVRAPAALGEWFREHWTRPDS